MSSGSSSTGTSQPTMLPLSSLNVPPAGDESGPPPGGGAREGRTSGGAGGTGGASGGRVWLTIGLGSSSASAE
eukprot:5593899-Prymnesium_polylepis.1